MKNSWGDTWGQEGYILLERSDSEEDDGGECGLLIEATYPVLEPISAPDDEPVLVSAEVVSLEMMGLVEVERPLGFESSATANDCGGGTSDVVFDDGEQDREEAAREGWCFVVLELCSEMDEYSWAQFCCADVFAAVTGIASSA